MLDRGYFRITNAVGSVLLVFSLFMLSLAHRDKYYQIYLSQGLGFGIGAGLIYGPVVAIQAHYWRKRRALAMAIVNTGVSVGGIFFPIMLNQLINKSGLGFAWSVRASAFLCLGLLIISGFLMRPNEDVLQAGKPKPDYKAAWSDVSFLLACIGVSLAFSGLFFPYFYLQLYSILHGVDKDTAFYALSILNAAAIPGRIIPNLLADKFGPLNIMVPNAMLYGAIIFAVFGVTGVNSMVAFAIVFGFFSGGLLALTGPYIAMVSKDASEVGARFGIAYVVVAVGAFIGQPINGALLGNGDSFPWYKPIIFSAVTPIAGGVLILISRFMLAQRKGTQFV